MFKQRRKTIAIALFVVFATSQVYLVSFARDTTKTTTEAQQPLSGVLSTQGNQAVTVNGVSANSGATILSGATIETPAGVGADINFGPLGSLHIDPNTKVTVEFQNGSIKVTVLQGCVVLHTRRGTRGEVDSQGGSKTSDVSKNDTLPICAPGAVATAPAAAPPGPALGAKVIVPIFAGTGTVLALLAARGSNPSPTTP